MDYNNELKRQQEDAAFAHGLWWVLGAILVEVLVVLINQYYFNFTTDPTSVARAQLTYNIMQIGFFLAPLVFIAAGVMAFLQFKKTGTICRKVEGVLALSAMISLSLTMSYVFKAEGCSVMLMFIPVIGVLGFLFFLYQHDFFYSAAISGIGGLVLWMIWHQTANNRIVVIIGVIKVLVFAALFCWLATKLKQNKGTLTLLGHEVRFLSHDAVYPIIYISAGLTAAVTVVAFLVGGYVAYYLIYALAAWIFALLVYYTVRML